MSKNQIDSKNALFYKQIIGRLVETGKIKPEQISLVFDHSPYLVLKITQSHAAFTFRLGKPVFYGLDEWPSMIRIFDNVTHHNLGMWDFQSKYQALQFNGYVGGVKSVSVANSTLDKIITELLNLNQLLLEHKQFARVQVWAEAMHIYKQYQNMKTKYDELGQDL